MKKILLSFLVLLFSFIGFSFADTFFQSFGGSDNRLGTSSSEFTFYSSVSLTQIDLIGSIGGNSTSRQNKCLTGGSTVLLYSGSIVVATGIINDYGLCADETTHPFLVSFTGLLLDKGVYVVKLTRDFGNRPHYYLHNNIITSFNYAFVIKGLVWSNVLYVPISKITFTAPNLGSSISLNYNGSTDNISCDGVNEINLENGTYTKSSNYNYQYDGLTGVNIHRSNFLDSSVNNEFYNKTDIYLSGYMIKTFTGGAFNYNVFGYDGICVTSTPGFSGFITTLDITGTMLTEVTSGNVFVGFQNTIFKGFFSGIPIYLKWGVMFIVLMILLGIIKSLKHRKF